MDAACEAARKGDLESALKSGTGFQSVKKAASGGRCFDFLHPAAVCLFARVGNPCHFLPRLSALNPSACERAPFCAWSALMFRAVTICVLGAALLTGCNRHANQPGTPTPPPPTPTV